MVYELHFNKAVTLNVCIIWYVNYTSLKLF